MRIRSITLKNYRQFNDAQISFANCRTNDLHILIGTNGAGKTNLLNAINWCLYDNEPHLGDKSRAISIPNTITVKNMQPGSICIVNVEILCDDELGSITFSRSASFRVCDQGTEPFRLTSELRVITQYEGQGTKIFLNSDCEKFLNRFVPLSIREYFFFDGERLDKYFISESSIKIKDSIYEISQIKLLRTISNNLETVIKELYREITRTKPDIDKKRQDYEGESQNVEKLRKQLEEIKNQIRISEETIIECDEFLRGLPDIEALEQERASLIRRRDEQNEKIKATTKDYNSLIRQKTILINFYGALSKTLSIIDNLEERGSLPPNIDKNLLLSMLEGDICDICGNSLSEISKEKISNLIKKLDFSSVVSHDLVSIGVSLRSFQNEFETVLDSIKSTSINLEEQKVALDTIQKDINSISNKFEVFTDRDKIKQKNRERNQHELLRDSNLKLQGVTEAQLDIALKDLDKKKLALDNALNQNGLIEDSTKQLRFAEKTKDLAQKIENDLMNEVKEKIQNKTESIFKELVWKKNTFDKVILDDNYKINLYHVDGYECLGSCGAAERALFALSFTLAIHQESGFSSPLIIDTPIARISDTNRENFANTLIDVSKGKQIILFLTHAEYSPDVQNIINRFICSKSHLNSINESETEILEN